MDLDARLKGLENFKKKVEALLNGTGGGADETVGEMLNGKINDLSEKVSELGEHVSALQVSKDEAAEFSDRLTVMLTWFEANQTGIEELLSISDDMADKPATPGLDPAGPSGTANPGAASATGAVSTSGGTDGAPAAEPAPTGS